MAEQEIENYKEQCIDGNAACIIFSKKSIEMLHILILVDITMIHHHWLARFDIIPLPQMKNVLHNPAQTDGAFQ